MIRETATYTSRERYAFGFSLFGQNLIYGLFLNYFMVFLTDVYGVTAVAAGTLFLVARTWDAFNDPLMGVIVDRTRTRWGKLRPYLLFSPIPIAAATIACFSMPYISISEKILLAYGAYIIWGMLYTTSDVPLWALTASITATSGDRTKIISTARIFGNLGMMVTAIATIPLVEFFGRGDDARGYQLTTACFSALFVALVLNGFVCVRERVSADSEKPTLRESLQAVAHNRPLQWLILIALVGVFSTASQALLVYFASYNLGDRTLLPSIMAVAFVGMIVGMLPIARLTATYQKEHLLASIMIGKAVIGAAYWLLGYDNLAVVFTMAFLWAMVAGGAGIVATAMLTDTIDYMHRKTDRRSEGVIFSAQTFVAKMIAALGGFLSGLLLSHAQYVPNATQSEQTLERLFNAITLLPGLGGLLALLPLSMYVRSIRSSSTNFSQTQ